MKYNVYFDDGSKIVIKATGGWLLKDHQELNFYDTDQHSYDKSNPLAVCNWEHVLYIEEQ